MTHETTHDTSTTSTTAGGRAGQPELGALSGRGDLVIAGLLLVMAGVLAYGNLTMEVVGDGGFLGPQGFGWLVAALAAGIAIALAVTSLRRTEPERRELADDEGRNWTAVASVLGGLVSFALLIEVVGWLLMATAMFAAVAWGLGNRNLLRNVAVGLTMASIIQITFGGMLGLALPAGVLGGL